MLVQKQLAVADLAAIGPGVHGECSCAYKVHKEVKPGLLGS